MQKTSILFVCLGNICRSPMAEGVFRKLVADAGLEDRIHIDSAGTGAWHEGEQPDSRAQAAAARREVDLSGQRARKVEMGDFARYDLILAMDDDNFQTLKSRAGDEHHHKIKLFLEYAPARAEMEVPDPYYGGDRGFEHVLDLVGDAAEGLLAELRAGKI